MAEAQVTDIRRATSRLNSVPGSAEVISLLGANERFDEGDGLVRVEVENAPPVILYANCQGIFVSSQHDRTRERVTLSVRFFGMPKDGLQEEFRAHLFQDLPPKTYAGSSDHSEEFSSAHDDDLMAEDDKEDLQTVPITRGRLKFLVIGGTLLSILLLANLFWPRTPIAPPVESSSVEPALVEERVQEREPVRTIDIETSYRRLLENLIASRRMREIQLANQAQANNPDLQSLSGFIADKLEDIANAEKALARNREEFLLSMSTLNRMSQSSPKAFDEATKTMIRMMGSPNPPEHRKAVLEIRDVVSSLGLNAQQIENKALNIWRDWII